VDGKLSIVMGREEKDQTRTMAILPLESFKLRLRLTVKDNRIRGEYRLPGAEKWMSVGECDLPVKGEPRASLQVYQGPKTGERWVRFTEFSIVKGD
jgi:regulation of enolase protein 1 (concanavalin A-like superfamily)